LGEIGGEGRRDDLLPLHHFDGFKIFGKHEISGIGKQDVYPDPDGLFFDENGHQKPFD
jgi:hypothetical protein